MTALTLTPPRPLRSEEARRLAAWAVCWILLPNAGFWLLWLVGAPPRVVEILATAALGLVVRRASWGVKAAVFAATLAYSAFSFVAGLFNLSVLSLLTSLRFVGEMNPSASFEYVVAGACLVATCFAAARLLRAPAAFESAPALAVAALLAAAAAGADHWMSLGMRGAYGRSAPAGAPFGSAVEASGFERDAADRRHLVLVMVEAMGLPANPAMRERLLARWRRPDITGRYRVTTGAAPYFGSTTSGEMRELCGRWGDYHELLDRPDARCLPARLRRAGYGTTALHGFDAAFFDRRAWYPNVGFGTMLFRDALVARRAASCAGVFPGACDRDVPRVIGDMLAGAKEPRFVYWLTLNTHLPVPVDASLGTGRCAPGEAPGIAEHEMICRQFQLWDEMADRLARQLARPDMPPVDVLLVGDHMPPYLDRSQRARFDAERVPWILLRRR